ncbi:MAG: sulfotransferase [Deltaproteobacteria bacterium]|nr:sulfotransferase [Deltaproteobacteria bacterium]MBW2394218.1 sulfotransferase [Deltaproteobacteria bacterium]
MQDRLVFLIGPPRGGTTLTTRMLGAHSAIFAPVEPHLMPPLAHLGFHEKVEKAPYDPTITQLGLRELVGFLPGGEADYLDALRAATDHLYAKALEPSGRKLFLDKTPAYALVLDFLTKLYPDAKYLVLTRHPMAVWSSIIDSFFDGDHEAAHRHNPVLERYVPAIARFLREPPAQLHHLHYEELVQAPEEHMEKVCDFLEIPFEPAMIDYGKQAGGAQSSARGLGDPTSVAQQTRPTTGSIDKWAGVLAEDPARLNQCREIAARLTDPDLATWGYPGPELRSALGAIEPRDAKPSRTKLTRYALERRLLVRLRRNIHHNALGRLVRQIRGACDVLLR